MKRRAKVLLTMVLVLTMVLALTYTAKADDYSSHWSAQYIDEAISRGWMTGDGSGNLRPESAITRGEFAVMLWRALDQPQPQYSCPFNDVAESAFYYQAVTALFEAEVVYGLNSVIFAPNIILTREMGCTMLARAFNLNALDNNAYQRFADFAEISEWARAAISALVEGDYISGVGDNRIAPKQQLKRGEIAKLLTSVYNGVISATADLWLNNTALTGGPTITVKQTVLGSDEVMVTVTAADSNNTAFVGWRASYEDAAYQNKEGFFALGSAREFYLYENGWYAVYAENSSGYGSFKLFEVTTIRENSPKVSLSQRTVSGMVEITISVTRASSGAAIDFIGYRTAGEGDTFSGKSGFASNNISNNKFTVDPARNYGWYAVCAVDKDGKFGYRLIEVKRGGTAVTYTVTFDTNGGAGAFESQTVASGDSVSKPSIDPTRGGYDFVGWHTLQNSASPYDFGSAVTKNITLYAQWTLQGTCVVTFLLNNGEGLNVLTTQTVNKGDKVTEPTPAPVRSGYIFDGWHEGSGKLWDFNTAVTGSSAIMYLYAWWNGEPHTLFYNANAGGDSVSNMPSREDVEYGDIIRISNKSPEREGYLFDGWATTASGSVRYRYSSDEDDDGNWIDINGDVTLYAKWTQRAYFAPAIITASLPTGTVGAAYSQNLTADGDTPITWSISAGNLPNDLTLSSSGLIYGAPTVAGVFTFTVRAVNSEGSDSKPLSITIDADVQTYNITLSVEPAESGTVEGGGSIVQGDLITVTATPNAGYEFEGWYEGFSKINGAAASYSFTVTANRALAAKFTPIAQITYTITLSADPPTGGSVEGDGVYNKDEWVTVKAYANEGYTFLGWFEDDEMIYPDPSYLVRATANRFLVARFKVCDDGDK